MRGVEGGDEVIEGNEGNKGDGGDGGDEGDEGAHQGDRGDGTDRGRRKRRRRKKRRKRRRRKIVAGRDRTGIEGSTRGPRGPKQDHRKWRYHRRLLDSQIDHQIAGDHRKNVRTGGGYPSKLQPI